jgi:glycosyltransferase involved in cell wall biosynthesis
MPTATIAIPTRGERASLTDAVRHALDEANSASVDTEVLVVWSGRTEPTTIAGQLPAEVRHVFASKKGVAAARNVALREARGALVLFLDDDVVCWPGWLDSMVGAWRGGAHVLGGRVILKWPASRPTWITPVAASLLADFDLGQSAFDLQSHQALVSAGMGVDRQGALQLGGFNEGLGHGASTSLMGEETEFCQRALEAGRRVRYEPGAVVEHHLQPEEVTRQRFLSRMYRFGRTMTVLRPPAPGLFPILRRAGKALLLALSAPFTGNPTARLGDAAFLLGAASVLGSQRRFV